MQPNCEVDLAWVGLLSEYVYDWSWPDPSNARPFCGRYFHEKLVPKAERNRRWSRAGGKSATLVRAGGRIWRIQSFADEAICMQKSRRHQRLEMLIMLKIRLPTR